MKILIANDGPHAFYYIRMGYARAFAAAGHEVTFWELTQKSVHDAFDECNPDIFMGQSYGCSRSMCEAIKERPHMKVIMKAGDWGALTDTIPYDFNILRASDLEKQTILDLYNETGKPDYVHIYYHPSYLKDTHGHWLKNGVPIQCHMLAADVFDYTNGQYMDMFQSDITFVGGYWQYKSNNIDDYLIPLCNNSKYKIKIFGNCHWPVAQYCGFIPTNMVKHVLKSATICPQLHEPHSTSYGFDMSERTFKLLSNKCFCISDYVAGLELLFGNKLIMAKSADEFKEKIDYYLKHPDERLPYIEQCYEEVMNKHTYFHRAADIFKNLGFDNHAQHLLSVYNNLRIKIDEGDII